MENKNERQVDKKLMMNNGKSIPMIGLGTSGIKLQEEMDSVILNSYSAGYRMIDSAMAYKNENLIGNSIENLKIPRSELFLITKIPTLNVNPENAESMILESLANFKTDYLDLLLLHWPGFKDVEERVQVWKVLEKLVKEGKVLSIGVSNFLPYHLKTILDSCVIKPCVNQFELHPLYMDNETIDFCRREDIVIQAYSGFAKFDEKLMKAPVLENLCVKYNKKPGHILMRWHLQNNFITIPKSTKKERIYENVNIDDFTLTEDDIKSLSDLNCGHKVIYKWDPKTVLN
jgi:diketogulonate reductase-like aldo/keto reductase